ncbi:cytochrome C [Komagataeibacter rhaeticus]|uniref:c-type cytochrome n=1 Tax=Komagataeibacter rhaeticus TaxID=215221 RepID=UPI0004D51360|nr:c-type cytochrome [Komagataeibacter rhaeticus]KDU94648.1 cytochrome C [Komagataeibacter rhaeticus AF1]MBL7240268.1 c-type cytochrome [Komagataeibacter rhaeticus]PYD53709.1 cytochrome C [Komagataeibacter rhaeticus]GBQ10961.1 cytochrome c [Komagataeibacter rhaeticus DSM 16663]
MDSVRLNQLGAACLIAVLVVGASWGIAHTAVPEPLPARPGVAIPRPPAARQGPSIDELVARASVDRGHGIAERQCAMCHSMAPGGPAIIGPDLYGVVGTHVGDIPGYEFSDALKAHRDETWTSTTLSAWLKGPAEYAPGTKMSFPGIESDTDRADVIAYLRSLHPEKPE